VVIVKLVVCTCGPTPPLPSLTPSLPSLTPSLPSLTPSLALLPSTSTSTSLCRRRYPARARFAILCQSEPLHDTRSANMSREKKERGLTTLSSSSCARRIAMDFPTSTTNRPATYFNCMMSRRLRATQKLLARCPNPAYVLERISNTKK
jgi:hypothetical protein